MSHAVVCAACKGIGTLVDAAGLNLAKAGYGDEVKPKTCPVCNGEGTVKVRPVDPAPGERPVIHTQAEEIVKWLMQRAATAFIEGHEQLARDWRTAALDVSRLMDETANA